LDILWNESRQGLGCKQKQNVLTFDFFFPWIFSSWMGPLGFFVFSLLLLIFEEELEEYNFFFWSIIFFFYTRV
jgi:hypothetical protein